MRADLPDGMRAVGDLTEAERRLQALEERRDELLRELDTAAGDDWADARAEEIKSQVVELEQLVRQRDAGRSGGR